PAWALCYRGNGGANEYSIGPRTLRCCRAVRARVRSPQGANQNVYTRDGCDAAQPEPGRLAELAAHARRLGIQPAEPDQPPERRSTPARVVVGDAAGIEPGDAARARRHHVPAESEQRR